MTVRKVVIEVLAIAATVLLVGVFCGGRKSSANASKPDPEKNYVVEVTYFSGVELVRHCLTMRSGWSNDFECGFRRFSGGFKSYVPQPCSVVLLPKEECKESRERLTVKKIGIATRRIVELDE